MHPEVSDPPYVVPQTIDHFRHHYIEASNCGGVAVSGLEMAQNSQRLTWSTQEVDAKLKNIMSDCYDVRPALLFLPICS